LCYRHLGYKVIARAIGLGPLKVEFKAISFNHVIWFTKFR